MNSKLDEIRLLLQKAGSIRLGNRWSRIKEEDLQRIYDFLWLASVKKLDKEEMEND